MKAELRADGTLEIVAETEVEAYALKHWTRLYLEQNGATQSGGVSLLFRAEIPPAPLIPEGPR